MNDKTKILYDQLTKDGYDVGDYNSFSNNVKDDNKRKNLYNAITKDGYDVGDYDTFSAKLVGNNSQPTGVNNVTTTPQPTNTEETFVQNPKVRERILANTPDYFKSKGNNLSTLPLGTNIQDANDIAQEEQQRVALAERSANDPYMRQQELEHVFKPKNQEQINAVNKMIADARRQRAEERTRNAKAVKSDGIFSTLSQAYVAGEQNDTDKQLEYASSLMEEAQNITNEAKKKGNTNFFAGFDRGFKDSPLDAWSMGLQDLKNYSAAKKVLDKVDKGEQLNPAEDALMQALVTNAATKMYYSGDLGRGYKAGGVTAESLPFMLDMIVGMGTIQAATKPAAKALYKYALKKIGKDGLGNMSKKAVRGAVRTISGLGDVAAHTATFGGARVAADYQRRGMGDIQVSPNTDGTVSYAGRDNVQTGAEAIAKSVISTAAETGTELLGEYFAPMLGWVGKVTGANKIGKIIPASVGKAYSNIVNSQGFKNIQELAQRAKIADPIGEYGEEVVNNLISTAIGDMTPEELVDLDQNIDTFLGVAPMSVLFGAAGTGGYLREKYKNYRDMRTFENQMQETMGEDWSGVKEALQDADIETARDMVKDVLSSDMQPDMKKRAINYISSVLQEQTLQEIDKQQMPEQIAAVKKSIISNMQKAKDTLLNQGMSEDDISIAFNDSFNLSPDEMQEKYGADKTYDIYDYRNSYDDYYDYNYWIQNKAYDARKEAESQVEKMTNATTGTVMRVNSGLSKNPVNVLRGNIVFDNDGNVDQNQSDNTIYYLADDGKVKMAPISMFQSLVDDTPAEGLAQQAGQDAEEEVLQGEEAQINSTPEGQQQQIEIGTRFNQGGNNYEVTSKAADGYVVAALDADGNPMQSQQVSEGDLINAINSQNQVQPEQPVAQPDMNAQPQEGQTVQTEQPATQQTPDQPATAMSRIPLNEKGEQDFEKAPVEDTSAALIEISDSIDDAKDTAQQMIDNYNNELKKADKAKTTGSSIQEIVRLKQEKKANLQVINDKIAYWNKVASQIESQRPGGIIAQAEEEAKANQQRLDNMTQEQQQAAQQEVQKKIESGAYERKQPRKRVRYVKEDTDMGEAVTPLEHVLREIATGRVTFNWNDSGTTQGLGSHLGLASSPEERKKLIWALSSDGMTPEAAAEQIHADMPENLQGMVTDQDIFNMILNSFQEYGSPSKMWEEAKRMHGTDIEENIPGYKEDVERRQLEWEAGYNGMTVSEWIDYCDYIEEKINDMYSSVSDEELNTIFEQIYNDYEQRRTETESAGSTEGQPDGKQSDEVLPASESDNTGTGAEVEEQPQPANQVDGESGSMVPESEGTVAHNVEIMSDQVTNNDLKIVHDAVGKTFRSKNGDLMTIENYRTNWDERKKLHGVTYNFNGDVQKKNVFIAELANALTSGNWKEVDYNDSLTDPNKIKIDIEKAREEVNQNPSEAQKEAGNYKKGHLKLDGYDVTIENPKGSVRSGKDANGNEWSVTMNNDYGYIRGTEGVDGDHIDVFLSDNPELGDVFVIDQVNPDGSFDEHKVMYGFKSALAAKRAYLANYSKGWTGLGNITRVSKEEFKKWIDSSNRKTKPFAEYKSVKPVDNNKVTSVEEFMKNAESDYSQVERPSEEDLPELKKIANNVLQKGKNKSDITTEEGYNEMSATFEGIYPKEKALLDKYRDNGGVAWVDYDDKCVYRINYDPAKYKGKSDKVTVIKEYFKEKNNNIDNTDVNKSKKVNDNITEKDIQDSPFEQITKDGALAYLRGNVNFATSIAYQQIYNYVRNRSGNNQSDSGAGNPAQPTLTVDETTRRESRPDGVQAGEVAGENDNSSSSQNSKKLDLFPDGEGSDTGLRGKESSNDGVSSGDTGRKRSGRTGSNGRNVRKRAGERISKSPVKSNPERGGNSTSSERDGIIDEINSLLDDFVKAGNETASLSAIGMNPKQIEIAGKLLVAGVRLGYTYIKDGITKFNDWMDAMKEKLASPFSSAMKLTDAEIDEFIKDMWEYPHTVNGETRPLKEWASIMEADTLRNSVRSSLEDKRKLQEDAENIPVKIGDKANIVETLPYLLPQQQDDVFRAETQFFDQSHNDRDHAFGKGYLFTNGTGTGKTYTGLGIAKRFIKQGKDRILILTPSQAKVNDWINDAKNLGINLTALESTKDKGTGPVITTFANLRTNKELMKDAFDLVIYDESHRIMENKKGEETAGAKQHYMLTNKNVDEALRRIQLNHPLWIKEKELLDELKDVEDQINPGKNPPEKINEYKEKRKELSSQLIELQRKQKEVLPEMENQAKEDVKRTKVVFLSATPFNTIPSLSYAEGYIFSYPEENKNTVGSYNHRSPRALFLEQNFGAGYKWRYGGIENSIENPEALSRQEVQFSDYLENVLGTKSGRIIDSEYDYSRDFPTVTFDMAPLFNQAIEDVIRNEELNILYDAFSKVFFDYNYSTALFETMKIAAIMPRIRKHLEMGRKVVVFHRRVESKTPLQPPFELSLQIAKEQASEIDTTTEDGKEKKKQFFKAIMLFRQKYGKLLYYEQKMNYSMPRKQVADAFGADNVLFFSGNESKTYKNNAIKQFNDDNSGKDIIVIQESSGKEGISLHDTTGKHQRVLITLALPQSPITALQIEGRIYRIGNKSNAIFEYPLLGLNLEKILFGKQFNNQVSTTENLALGSKARNLRDSFAEGVVSNSGDVPLDRQGVGGKEFDNKGKEKTDAFDNSISDYYGTQKLRPGRNNRSGIDYFPTPEPVGYKMVEWARLSENEDVLEPSAGHGAIARYVPKSNGLTAIEPSTELFPILQLRAGGQGRKFVDTMFENYNLVNKFDAVLMNPPYGTAGRTAIDHLQKAFNHLNEGGRVIAIIPRGSADSKFDKWYESEKGAHLVGEVLLPSVTFNRAGTSVSTRIVVIDKVTRPEAAKKVPSISRYDLSEITDIDGNDGLFEAIRNIQMPERTIDQTGIDIKNAKKTLKDFKDIKSVYEADVDEQGVTVRGTYGMNFVQTFENIRKPAVYYAYKKSLDELRKESDQKANVGRSVQERISFLDTVLATIRNVSGKTEEQIMEEQSKNANSSKLDTLYEFVPDKDTRNNNDIYLAKPYNKGQLSKDQYREIANLAKKNNGYWSSFKKAFLFNSESDARSFLNEDLNSDENGIRFREDNTRSIVDPFINDLMKEYAGEDLSRYPFEDKRTDPNNDYNVYWGYSEPLYNGKNIDGNEEVPEVIRDIIRNDEYEIDKQNIIDTLKRYIEFNEGFDEELEYKKVLDWFQENKDKFSMSPKVNLIVDRDSIPDNLYRVEEKDDAKTSEEVKSVSEKLNVPVEVVTSPDQIKDQSVRKAIESGRKVKGWYSISEGKVYLYLPNATSMEDAVQTLLHEDVAHYGLRRLVGEERMDDFLDDIFTNASKEVRQRIIDTLPKYGYNSRIATEEYMARMAEKGVDDVSFWDRIKQAFKNLLRRIGININVNDNELRYILWRSRQNLNKERPLDMAKDVAMQYQMEVGNYYRDDTSDGSREAYENSLQGWRYKAREAYQDSMLALKNLQDVVAKVSGKPIQGFENAYIAENQLSSRNTTEARRYNEKFFKPLMDAEGKLIKKYGLTHKAIERYMMLAHGIERNVEMTFREQLNDVMKNDPDNAEQFAEDFRQEKERLRSLYSGYEYLKELTDYIGEVGEYSATKAILQSMDNEKHDSFQDDALDYVKDFENTYDVKELWDKTNKATKETLRKSYESGMMSKDHFANVSNMFMYYVPLRGWNEKTAEDVYEYINSERSPVNSVLKSMKGRKSIPDEIMATIGNMAESAIVQGNRNLMKQAFMNMVMNHPTDLATLKKAWYVYDPATDEWNISLPDIEENNTPETIAQKIQDHEDVMNKLKDQGLATQKSSRLNINYKITKGNVKQHVVQVKNGGKDYLIYVNANPRAAQAVNGLTNPDAEKNPIFNAISTANRWLAANFTTRNPAFVMSNLSRDLIFSMAAINIKEDGKYSARFRKNIFKAMPVIMRNLRGNDKGTESDKYFKEFIENGGETGYMHLTDVNEYKKKVRQELRKITGKQGSARAAFDYTLERLEDFNRWAEDVSRFSVYMTSRQMGRSIVDSINDAKEVTVNFNKKGAGYKTGGFFGITAEAMRNLYLFFNASVQSLTNFNRLRVKNPTKFYSTLGGFMAAGFLMPVINNLFHSIFGDGDDPYNDLPEWVRRNNLCIYAGDGQFVTIPLPIELRAFYGLGDYAYQLIAGREKPTPAGISKGTINQLADLLPLNPTGNEGFKTFMPDALSPIFQAYVWNRDFTDKPIAKLTPFNERDPEWKRVYKGTSGWLVDISKFLNDISNGGGAGKEFRKGFMDFNPAKVEHLFESYFGGMAKTFNQAGKTIYYGSKSLMEGEKDDNLIMRNVPIANRFVNTVDERNSFSGINREYFSLRDEMEQFKYELNGVKKNYRNSPEEYKELIRSDMFRKYMKYKPYQDRLDRLYQMAKEMEGEERKQIEDMIVETRRELLQAVK